MFPNTPEVFQMVFSLSLACLVNLELPLKTIDLFRYLRGTLVVTKILGGFFVSSESVSYPYGSGRKSELMK